MLILKWYCLFSNLEKKQEKHTKTHKKTQKKKSNLCDNHLFRLKTRKKKEQRGDSRPKLT
jgi:hypothetical protein